MAYDINKPTNITLLINWNGTSIPETRKWLIDNVEQPPNVNASDSITIPANTFNVGNHTVSFTASNVECGSNTLTQTLYFTDGLISPELIINGGFDTNTSSWSSYPVSISASSGECVANISTIPTDMFQDGIILEQGTQYKLKFDAYTQTPKPLDIILQGASSPNTVIKSFNIPSLLANKTTYELAFTTTTVPTNTRLRFRFTQSGIYYIDNVSIMESDGTCPNPICNFQMTVV